MLTKMNCLIKQKKGGQKMQIEKNTQQTFEYPFRDASACKNPEKMGSISIKDNTDTDLNNECFSARNGGG